LDVVRISRSLSSYFLDQYEAALDGVTADCDRDLRGPSGALMLANEHLEQTYSSRADNESPLYSTHEPLQTNRDWADRR
jgi:hypothetical protein